MSPHPGAIRTPDQRLRVFVSSTLKELALERRAVKTAVERLHLAPVMFELGARPHPPRALYRAYLEQSEVFVGLYAERYGWVAPGEEVSGLEDEYLLAPADMPRLIYIREPAPAREPRLGTLLDRIRDDDRASFKYFASPQELRRLVEADLATMLAERFDESRHQVPGGGILLVPTPGESSDGGGHRAQEGSALARLDHDTGLIPSPLTGLIGREREMATIQSLVRLDTVRLLTLTGPGGIGKSRLAIAVARSLSAGVSPVPFVDLSAVPDASLVPNGIAEALGVLDTGDEPLIAKLTAALRGRTGLVVLDNFEHVLEAAPLLVALLAAAPGITFLVTSRVLLRVTGEHAVDLGPIGLPDARVDAALAEVAAAPAVALFVERARAMKPDFELTTDNVAAVAAICTALDGVPLALELAAARIRLLTPASMLARLDRSLPLLTGGARDRPARHQTLRSTIDWSVQLLGPEERRMLERLGVFAGGFSLEAMERVGGHGGAVSDPLASLEALVDGSLVREEDRGGQPHYSMLATVREHARDALEQRGDLHGVREVHAAYYVHLATDMHARLAGTGQHDAVMRLNDERDNLRAAVRFLLDERRVVEAADFAWHLLIYWWVGGQLGEVRGWMAEVLESGIRLPERTRAVALFFTRMITLWQHPGEGVETGLAEGADAFHAAGDLAGEGMTLISRALADLGRDTPDVDEAERALDRSLSLFRETGDTWGETMALVTLGRVCLMRSQLRQAVERFERGLELARSAGEELGAGIALNHLGWAYLVSSQPDAARDAFEQSLMTAARLGHAEGVAYGIEGLTAIAAAAHDAARAGRLLRAAEALRRQTGLDTAARFSFHDHYLAPILAGASAADLEHARTEGREPTMEEAVALALDGRRTLVGV